MSVTSSSIAMVQALDRQQRILLGPADDQPRNDMDDPHASRSEYRRLAGYPVPGSVAIADPDQEQPLRGAVGPASTRFSAREHLGDPRLGPLAGSHQHQGARRSTAPCCTGNRRPRPRSRRGRIAARRRYRGSCGRCWSGSASRSRSCGSHAGPEGPGRRGASRRHRAAVRTCQL